ncbi:MAG: Gldg family protein [Gammaproteobacteria bacterium]|jgi:ABC-2 type transport system permease protein
MRELRRIAGREFSGFFSSPAAFLFLGAFLAVTLFVFFWVETFFARNIADVRPLFQWMPVLLIFLVAALTMRAWSEERRAGTLETLLTSPVRPLQLVLGKFLAGLALVAVALLLTLPLPLTVALLGPLDWGPVIGGYVAALFLAAAYVAIGLYMSARTDNPIVALILTVVVCGVFYLLGSPMITSLFGHQVGGVLAQLGTGSRFDSITRGVLDLRDLYYYLSIVGVFLALNLFSLERLRWAGNPPSKRHRQWGWLVGLTAANFIAGNLWLAPVGWVRADITQGNIYSLSDATRQYLGQLQEPLLIRGYFSAKTHPLLAPLVPRLRDLLEEYAVAGGGQVRVEFVDPHEDQALEEEAASKYGIRPVPFQMASKYQTSVVSSYFDILVAYGDQHEVLGYRDLIEVKARGERDLDVVLKNPEYAITRSIRKVLTAYQAGGNPFETLTRPVQFTGYISPDEKLPDQLVALRRDLEAVLGELKQEAGDKLTTRFQDPDAGEGALAEELKRKYGFGPQIASLFDPQPFWFYMVLAADGETVQVPLPEELDRDGLERALEAAFQRLAPGFLKTVAVVKPPASGPDAKRYTLLTETLTENARIKETDLKDGRVPADADLLLLLAPEDLDEKQLFAIDQFLMQGGSLVLATSPFDARVAESLKATKHQSGLEDWLAHQGLTIEDTMVLDPQNAALPVPVQRSVGGLAIREIRMLPYPHFPDVRGEGLNSDHPITAALGQVTLNWVSPITVDEDKNQARSVAALLRSSDQSWVSPEPNIMPDYQSWPDTGFEPGAERGARLLGVAVEGRFDSYFKGKDSPLAKPPEAPADTEGADAASRDAAAEAQETPPPITGVIDRSPESARIILVASNTFADDAVLSLASEGLGTLYTKPAEFLQNAVDWSLEDRGLLAIRSRAQFARTLAPMDRADQLFWEYLNYSLALLGLVAVWFWRRWVHRAEQRRYQAILAEA